MHGKLRGEPHGESRSELFNESRGGSRAGLQDARGGLRGETGRLTGLELLEALEKLGCSGTLVLEQASNSLFVSLNRGRLEASHKLGRFNPLDSDGLQFHFEPHEPGVVPQVGSRFPTSPVAALRALPGFGLFTSLGPRTAELPAVLDQLRSEAFTGCLTLETSLVRGLVLFYEGGVGAAFYEEDGRVREHTAALRALRRAHADDAAVRLYTRTFHPYLLQGLLGLALDLPAQDPPADNSPTDNSPTGNPPAQPPSFSGLESSERGYTFVRQGAAVLQVTTELRAQDGRYPLCTTPPGLQLPDEPAGFEFRRYLLTLRGKDALNPMSEVSSQFRHTYGSGGARVLEQLKQGFTVESVSQHLGVELSAFKPQLDALETEGFIRHVDS